MPSVRIYKQGSIPYVSKKQLLFMPKVRIYKQGSIPYVSQKKNSCSCLL
jgi:hypothetical protein